MKTVLLIMKRASVAQGLIMKSGKTEGIHLVFEPDYNKAAASARTVGADAVLIEIAETGMFDSHFCIGLCDYLKGAFPHIKLVIMCPETNADAVADTIKARKSQLIDDFVFYDVSMEYLLTSLRAL